MFLFVGLAVALPPVRVEPGVYTVDGREVWLNGFALDGAPGAEDSCQSRALPTVEERRVAARNPAFVPSALFEALANPSDDPCGYSMAVVEAEGIDGWLWFGGAGNHLGESEVRNAPQDPREGVIRVHSVAWSFFGEDAKPAPRGERCVTRDALQPTPAWIAASSVNVRAGRATTFVALDKVEAGGAVKVWHREADWAWVEAPKSVLDTSGSEPNTHECTVFGWVKGEFLTSEKPDPLVFVRQAEAVSAAGSPADAVVPLERAAALHPNNPAIREALAEVYAATGHDKAAVVARQAAALRAKSPSKLGSPGSKALSLATACPAVPLTAAWTSKATGTGCRLPWSAGVTEWLPGASGWVDLDPADLETQCGADPTPDHHALSVAPANLLVRIPPGSASRAVHVRRRVVRGVEEGGQFGFTGFGPWETLVLRSDLGAEAAVVEVPIAAITGGAILSVELDVEVYDLGEGAAPATSTLIQVVWPLNC